MIKHGKPPYLECDSQGDRRFSAFFAIVHGRSIEEQYQAAKVFPDGSTGLSWREAKGRRPVNFEETENLYRCLWELYLNNHPVLIDVLVKASGVSDRFGKPGHVCQATTLWELRAQLTRAFNDGSEHRAALREEDVRHTVALACIKARLVRARQSF